MAAAIRSSRRTRRRHRNVMSDINVTPMVDVMLVLLVIFMVTAPLLTTGMAIDLPKGTGEAMQGSDKSLDISINANGSIFLATEEVQIEHIIPRLKAMVRNNPELRIIISGDRRAAYGRIIEVMGLLKNAGFTKVGLKTDNNRNKKEGS
ncbi:MAG: protein TolR [Alphaproteobacteria bacterium]|nr:protein TolR [Alphaproteobacteria bacterium]